MTRVAVTESNWTETVIALCQRLNWRVAHFRPAMTQHGWRTAVSGDGVGFPDVIAARGGRIIAVELKVGFGEPTPEQLEWLAVLATAGVETRILRPEDFEAAAEWLR